MSSGLRVLVCGGRDYADDQRVLDVLDEIQPDAVIQGGSTGVDAHARNWAMIRGKPNIQIAAHWRFYQKAAGPLRNAWMIEHGRPDLVVAFPGGKGTADMVAKARAAGIEVREVS